jgi:hypothetical protein
MKDDDRWYEVDRWSATTEDLGTARVEGELSNGI